MQLSITWHKLSSELCFRLAFKVGFKEIWLEPKFWNHELWTIKYCTSIYLNPHFHPCLHPVGWVGIHSYSFGNTAQTYCTLYYNLNKRVFVYNSTVFKFTDLFISYSFIQNIYANKKLFQIKGYKNMQKGSNCDRKSHFSEILTEPLNPRDTV